MSERLILADESSWPSPDEGGESVEWKLRFAPQSLTRADHMCAATIISAYGYLFEPSMTTKAMSQKVAMLRRAYREAGVPDDHE
jgi:hypothetical protein